MWQLTIFDWSGILSVMLAVLAYGLLQTGYIRGTGSIYPGLYLISALLMLVSLWKDWNAAAFVVEVIWIVISVYGLVRTFVLTTRADFSDEEMTLISDGLPNMARPTARQLLNKCTCVDAAPGTLLTAEGTPVTHLHFIVEGAARVLSDGSVVGTINRGFIGEMEVMEAAPASATVEIVEAARIYSIAGTVLRALTERDDEFAHVLGRHLAESTRRKLIDANARLAAHEKRNVAA
ncbi:Crp/Fnr family transcriptional regulator [Maritimibacter sp. DP1N21-5]|uniref:Crp/Fnr family transcriptional regulator n=1 Tax=Maritimibacter sp. DP1N21-5 TaxID=2836867 RepID=UPI001C49641C|nr:cyclic nucleotide-binding domain-containing protein [Maritimibacter sp. DP1N21-5]MBV7408607.1 cyclic nucleotide-binding domain-containing protein [Maritimibacter sp. DP1N21-5]